VVRGAAREGVGPLPANRGPVRAVTILLVTVLAVLLAGRFLLAGSEPAAAPAPAAATAAGTAATVAGLQERLRATPDQPALLTRLGTAYLTRARETADPTWYGKAEAALGRSYAIDRASPDTLTALGVLGLARHDFRGALAWAGRARAHSPDAADPLGVVFDAQVELGRYREALATAQAMVDRKPNLASLARVSHIRELLGDAAGALLAMEQAVVAGAGSPADVAYVQTLIGDLRIGQGRLTTARAAYRRALQDVPGYAAAEVGLARVAAARGELAGAAELLEPVAARLPLPATVALLGEVRAGRGQGSAAASQYRLVRAIAALQRANGVAVDLELARFEAGHARDPGGEPARAVALARAALRQRPTIHAEDALAWALRQAGRPREALAHARAAVRLGTRDATLWYHLAAIEADVGMRGPARRDLSFSLGINPYLMGPDAAVRDRADAGALAARLGVAAPSSAERGPP
jgi:tetratricopeptide (TPR) repeat protein